MVRLERREAARADGGAAVTTMRAHSDCLRDVCCVEGLRYLGELPNDQHADPGWRHVRLDIRWMGGTLSKRIRYCPFCGSSFREPLPTSELASMQQDARDAIREAKELGAQLDEISRQKARGVRR
jgi:hypothetical protein